MRTPEYIVKIAADSIAKLRRVDVYRVLDNCSDEERKPMARAIVAAHPDYAGEINAIWNDEYPFEKHEKDEDCIVGPEGLCVLCHVYHGFAGDGCVECAGHGFHNDGCVIGGGRK